MRSLTVIAATAAAISAVLLPAANAGADLGRVVALGDSMAAGTLLGPQVPGSILACGQSTGSYPELAMARVKHGTWVNSTCNGGHTGVFSNSWSGLPASPPYQYNDGTTIPPQYNAVTSSTEVVILGSGGNEAYYGEVTQACLGHSTDYNANTCTTTYGADGAGLLAKTNNSKTLIAGALDTIHTKAPNAKVFLVGVPRVTPPDGAGCMPNPILTLADAPVWAVWEDSLRAAMMADVAARSSWAYYVDMQSAGGNTHTMCAPNGMRWMNPWTVDNSLTYPGLALHHTPWGADATADALIKSMKAAGLNTGTPNTPTLTRSSPTGSPTNSTSQTFTYSGTAGYTFKCRLDSAAYAACPSSPVTITGVPDGAHTYSVTQTDASGNVSPAALVTWTVDTGAPAAPTLTRTAPNTSPTASATQTLTYSGAESGGTYQCKLDGAAYAACSGSPVTVSGLTTGNHTYSVRQVDDAGNLGTAATASWTVDVTAPGAPTVVRSSPTATPTNSTTQVLTYAGAEGGGTFQCSLDSAAYSACSGSPVTLTGLAPGTHTYSVTQTDSVGNVGSAATLVWDIDTTAPAAPSVSRTSPTASPTNSPTQTLSYSGTEAGGSFKCKLDSAAYAACSASPVTVSGLASGSHTYSVTQTDAAGNTSTAGTVAWTVDVTPPPTPNVSGPSGLTAFNSATITYSDSESGVTFQCKLDAAAYDVCPASPISLSGLSNGAHTYYVTATDATGNVSAAGTASWTVDPSGFTVSITANPSNPSTSTSASFSFVATITSGTTYECKLDAAAFSGCTSAKSYAGLADGSHTFTVRALNGGQYTPDVSRTWQIDATPPGAPSLTRTAPTASPTNSTSQTFSLTAAEAGGVLSCKLDGAAYATCPSSPITVAGLANGAHSFSAFQTDAAGNAGTASTVSWTVDITPPSAPTVTRTSPTAIQTNSTSQTITYGGIEGGATTQCKLDTAAYGACPVSPVSLSGLTQGSHTYSVIQTDSAGNVSAEGSVTWSIDSIAPGAPTVLRTSPTASPANSATQEIAITAAESGGTLLCKLDSNAYAACPASPVTLTDLDQGGHTFSVTQTDATGNVSSVSSVAWVVDTIAPAAPIQLGFNRASFTQEDSATVGITPAESGGTFQCSLDSAAWTTCPSNPVELTGLAEGNHNFMVRQVDAAGNIGGIKQVAWTVDRVAPDAPTVTRTSPATSPSYSTSAVIAYVPEEINGTLQCKLDGAAYTTCPSSPVSLSGLSYATHTFYVRQVDAAGNAGAAGTATWIVEPDTTPPAAPTVARSNPTVSPTTSTAQIITYSAAEPGGSMKCRLDGGAYTACQASPVTINGLADGQHTVYITQTDSSGNVSTPGTVTWTVDTTPPAAPTVTRTSPSANPTPLGTQTINYSGAEAGGTYQCKLDSASYSACPASPVSLSGLADGTHTYSVTQTDAAGNVGSAFTVTWVIDSSAPSTPEVARTSPSATPTNSTSQTITYSGGEPGGTFQCKLDAAAYSACASSPVTLSGLSPGSHSFSVIQTDAVGNVGLPGTVTWIVDITPPSAPSLSRTSPTGTPTNSTSQTITYGGLEAGASVQCKLDGGSFAACAASPMTFSGLSAGTHTLSVTQTDIAGNTGAAASVSWVVDTSPPPTPVVSGPSGTSGLRTATIGYSDTESGVTFECKLDAASYAACPGSPVTLSALADGSHTYYVRATDAAGNVSAAGTATWTVDPSGFTVSITSAPSDPTKSTSAAFEFASTITSGTTYECKLDGGAFAACTSAKSYAGLADGSHTFAVRAVNGAQTTPESSRTWTVDATAPGTPSLTRTAPMETPTNSSSQTFTFDGDEPGGVLNCKVNDSEFTTCPSSPVTLTGLGDGIYTLSVTQTDAAGNVSNAATVVWVVDTLAPAAPVVTRTSPTQDPTSSASQAFSIGGEDDSTFECKLDDAGFSACSSGAKMINGLAVGSHSLAVRQTDAAGNTSAVGSVSWTVVAQTPPTDEPDPPVVVPSALISAIAPKAITPARSGAPFSLKSRKTAGSFRVSLTQAATVSVRLERIVSGTPRAATAWSRFKLKSGKTRIYLTGRASSKRALGPGTYKVHLTLAGSDADAFSQIFRVKR